MITYVICYAYLASIRFEKRHWAMWFQNTEHCFNFYRHPFKSWSNTYWCCAWRKVSFFSLFWKMVWWKDHRIIFLRVDNESNFSPEKIFQMTKFFLIHKTTAASSQKPITWSFHYIFWKTTVNECKLVN